MPKTRRSAVKEKHQKLVGPRSQKYDNILPGAQSQKMKKIHKSAFMRTCQELEGQRSQKNAKTRRSVITENAKNSEIRVKGKMPKTHRSVVVEKCLKLASPR